MPALSSHTNDRLAAIDGVVEEIRELLLRSAGWSVEFRRPPASEVDELCVERCIPGLHVDVHLSVDLPPRT